MADSVAGTSPDEDPGALVGVVLAAGEGRRLRPLSLVRPKALCPVGGVPLVDLALARVAAVTPEVAVNLHHGRPALEAHLTARHPHVHRSVEVERALGTAGALGHLRGWLAGRAALVVNADTWCPSALGSFVDGWDRTRVRLVVSGAQAFSARSRIVASLLPWSVLRALPSEPLGLYESVWEPAAGRGELDVVHDHGPFVDCGTPADYLQANLLAVARAGHSIIGTGAIVSPACSVVGSVVGAGARVAGDVVDSVVWDGAEVAAGERLVRAVRTERGTVLVR